MTERTVDLSRYDDWLAWLAKQGETDPDVSVVFVGGSAVTGGYDEHSDLDVEVLTTPGESVATYRRLLEAAAAGLRGGPGLGAPRGDVAGRPAGLPQPHRRRR